jgi:hypothetical protein
VTADAEYVLEALEGRAEIVVDRWGVPHLYGSSLYDTFRVQGPGAPRDACARPRCRPWAGSRLIGTSRSHQAVCGVGCANRDPTGRPLHLRCSVTHVTQAPAPPSPSASPRQARVTCGNGARVTHVTHVTQDRLPLLVLLTMPTLGALTRRPTGGPQLQTPCVVRTPWPLASRRATTSSLRTEATPRTGSRRQQPTRGRIRNRMQEP